LISIGSSDAPLADTLFVPDAPEDDDDDETADEAKATAEKVDIKPH